MSFVFIFLKQKHYISNFYPFPSRQRTCIVQAPNVPLFFFSFLAQKEVQYGQFFSEKCVGSCCCCAIWTCLEQKWIDIAFFLDTKLRQRLLKKWKEKRHMDTDLYFMASALYAEGKKKQNKWNGFKSQRPKHSFKKKSIRLRKASEDLWATRQPAFE